jgi:predicted small secreted protein
MKAQFYLGMGLGIAAGTAVTMLMKPKKTGMQKAMDSARKTVDQAMQKLGG